MLVLSRKSQEQIIIGDDIIVTVLEVNGNRVKLGFDADKETLILRGELDHGPQCDTENAA